MRPHTAAALITITFIITACCHCPPAPSAAPPSIAASIDRGQVIRQPPPQPPPQPPQPQPPQPPIVPQPQPSGARVIAFTSLPPGETSAEVRVTAAGQPIVMSVPSAMNAACHEINMPANLAGMGSRLTAEQSAAARAMPGPGFRSALARANASTVPSG